MRFEFIADRPILDFVPTLAERGTTNVERLHSAADLADWITQARIVDTVDADDTDLVRARELREAAFGLLAALIDHAEPAFVHRTVVNEAASGPLPRVHLDADGVHRTGTAAAALAVLARDCLDLHDSPDRHDLRWCDGDRCTRPFVDRSRGGRRRWCGMRGCGDRAKAAAYRQRRRKQ